VAELQELRAEVAELRGEVASIKVLPPTADPEDVDSALQVEIIEGGGWAGARWIARPVCSLGML
jgi:hypothetical protein